jgi:hypothetical protein
MLPKLDINIKKTYLSSTMLPNDSNIKKDFSITHHVAKGYQYKKD